VEGSRERWATCALTQLGFIRISGTAAKNQSPKTPSEAASLLGAMTGDALHVYLSSLAPPTDVWMRRAHGAGQVTDAYLLALAEEHDATFLTFDARLTALAGSKAQIEVLAL
jgi:predicted nucleic acid-binding protein